MRFILLSAALMTGTAALAHEVIHSNHAAAHSIGDGHMAINHDGHVDHLHDGHLHHVHGSHVDEHVLAISAALPADEQIVAHVDDKDHTHNGSDPDHPRVQHGDHFDHIHNGRLHFVHGDHVDDHGAVQIVK